MHSYRSPPLTPNQTFTLTVEGLKAFIPVMNSWSVTEKVIYHCMIFGMKDGMCQLAKAQGSEADSVKFSGSFVLI